MKYSKENGIDTLKNIFNSKYCSFVKKQIKGKYNVKNGTDGVIDIYVTCLIIIYIGVVYSDFDFQE